MSTGNLEIDLLLTIPCSTGIVGVSAFGAPYFTSKCQKGKVAVKVLVDVAILSKGFLSGISS